MVEFVLKVFAISVEKLDMALIRVLTRRRSRSGGRAVVIARRRAALVAVLGCAVVLSATVGLAVAGGSPGLEDGDRREGTPRGGVTGMQIGHGQRGRQRGLNRRQAVSSARWPGPTARGSAPTSRDGAGGFASRRVYPAAVMASRGAVRPAGRPGRRRGTVRRPGRARSAARHAASPRGVRRGHRRLGGSRRSGPRARVVGLRANGRRAGLSRPSARRAAAPRAGRRPAAARPAARRLAAAAQSRTDNQRRFGARARSGETARTGAGTGAADRPRARIAAADAAPSPNARRPRATPSDAGGAPPSGGRRDEATAPLVFLGPLSLDGPSARRAVFSAPPLRRLSLGTRADPRGRAAAVVRRGSRAGTGGGSGRADGSEYGSADGGALFPGDPRRRRASNDSEALFSPLEQGPLAPLADAAPQSMQWLLAALGALAVLALGGALLGTRRSGRAGRRGALPGDLGLPQSALLPPVPARVGGLGASVAYRPWPGPGSEGDFYDVFPLADGRAGAVLGAVGGHGPEAIGRASGLRHTLRAYLEAGLEPRAALELAGRVLEREGLAQLATAVLAVHDPGRETLTWASAGHQPPILLGADAGEPLTAVSAPPLGAGIATGLRQTTVPLPPGATACLFSDGVSARTREGRLGRARLAELADGLGDRLTARNLLDRVSLEAFETTDDMAVCILEGVETGTGALERRDHGPVEELALSAGEVSTSTMQRFLWACGVEPGEALATIGAARELARSEGAGVLLRVETHRPSAVEISPLARATLAPVS